jgi:hypothetical protein
METIHVKSIEQETNLRYDFILYRDDAEMILENEGIEHLEIENGWVEFKDGKIVIRKNSSPAYLDAKEVLNQIREQL